MIKHLKVQGLNDKISCDWHFNADLNIITGRNGSGKTTLLKLMWYLISGNLERIFPEMNFNTVFIETDKFSLSVIRRTEDINIKSEPEISRKQIFYAFTLSIGSESIEVESSRARIINGDDSVEALNQKIAKLGNSIFFPTFRRVEGGFSLDMNEGHGISPNRIDPRYFPDSSLLQEAMGALSRTVSVYNHKFVSSISTQDIVQLLSSRYASISEGTNSLHRKLSSDIIERISTYSKGNHEMNVAEAVLHEIAEKVNDASEQRESLLKPFSELSKQISSTFQHNSIKVTEGLTLGEAANAISSDKLSAGEKQMLSFLCYNAFYKESPIFIDEPELSLHVDWQRTLFPKLLNQGANNQFIVATHSPFIFSKYPDKELVLNQDRGE